ncbi:16S rRNA (adenine(1518)-N(6)/adenine(1519)-N(6))-dimethyltransferase RsmA [Thermorudis peleae]|uniref:16S rRNA (adenine(1518)-N(6)/adenine(1519)-N(6))- dimethyltransferase RsmA n=1 Tax=Thermorudis peleae TaxID=1382356 RepID=UPI00068E8D98|nr:16S rRNA (adenine(1518)-N(6)/adenine(1519)-N(6))-dimethyltransferase RsmA [Thermorudis peleae]
MVDRPARIRDQLSQLGLRPRKALGQHFLHDRGIVQRIVTTAQLMPGQLVVEIGPGLGMLTAALVERGAQVIAIELDADLAQYLTEHFAGQPVTIVHADALTVDYAALTGGQPYVVVANLPYNVATAILERLLTGQHPPERLVVMVQREVAERLAARPPQMSLLSVLAQTFTEPRIVFRIGPGAFVPPPKVESAVVTLDRRAEPLVPQAEQSDFFRVVQAGFQQRRKQLVNALAHGLGLPKPAVHAALQAAAIAPTRRAETLTIAEWLTLSRTLREQGTAHDVAG